MNWRIALMVVGGIWVLGWLIMSTIVFLRTASIARQLGDAGSADSRRAAGCTFILGFFLFPVICLRLLGEYAPRLGVWLRLRPDWSVRAEGEEVTRTWYLKDGTELRAGVFSLSPYVAADIQVQCVLDDVAYRVRKLAPEAAAPTEWEAMKRLSLEESTQNAGEQRDQKEKDGKQVFAAEVRLRPGKYLVSFKVVNRYAEPEEFSGLTLIVRD
jgi:hypothetical protein